MSNIAMFESREALHRAAADAVALALKEALLRKKAAYAALSGGSTPGPVYDRLSKDNSVDWSGVTVTLVDERLTAAGDPHSNETLIRGTLLQHHGAAATFEPLCEGQSHLPQQDVMVLGMGADGHFASLFPSAVELDDGLAEHAPPVLKMTPDPLPPNAPFARLTLTLPAIIRARRLIMVITGDEKRDVLNNAREDGPWRDLPIGALLAARHPDFTILWAP